MKKQILIAIAGVFLTSNALMASEPVPVTKVSDKVAKSFERSYKSVEDLKWYAEESDGHYIAVFKQEEILVKAKFDDKGKLLTSTRFYNEETLPVEIREKVKKRFPDRTIFGVTEVTDAEKDEVVYYLKMQCEKNWYTVKVSDGGSVSTVQKYKKSA